MTERSLSSLWTVNKCIDGGRDTSISRTMAEMVFWRMLVYTTHSCVCIQVSVIACFFYHGYHESMLNTQQNSSAIICMNAKWHLNINTKQLHTLSDGITEFDAVDFGSRRCNFIICHYRGISSFSCHPSLISISKSMEQTYHLMSHLSPYFTGMREEIQARRIRRRTCHASNTIRICIQPSAQWILGWHKQSTFGCRQLCFKLCWTHQSTNTHLIPTICHVCREFFC